MNAQRRPTAEPELMDREIPPPDVTALPALLRAEIDGQIATARAFPRSVSGFIKEATELVCLDEAMAEACIFALPRGKGADKKVIEGPSARFAEVIQHCFGNNRGGARVVATDKQFVTAQGTYHDLEKNVQVVMETKRRITDKYGKTFNEDMIGVTGNAAAAIAHRNAVLKGIPKALWLPVYERARAVAVGNIKTLSTKRQQALDWFAKVGISLEQILADMELGGIEDIGLDELAHLAGVKTAIREGTLRPEDAFAPETDTRTVTDSKTVDNLSDRLEKRSQPKGQEPGSAAMTTKEIKAALFTAETVAAAMALTDAINSIPDDAERDELLVMQDSRVLALQ